MISSRRDFIKSTLGAGILAATPGCFRRENRPKTTIAQLDQAAAAPVLKTEYLPSPVEIASVELLRNGQNLFVRATSTEGAVGIAMTNNARMSFLYPILVQRVAPYFIGKDARDLDALIDGIYVHESNYKLQGLAFWIPVASVEFALLDLLGNMAGRPVGELLGGIVRRDVAVYRANNHRGKTAEESVELIAKSVAETGARAVKFKIGGRMSKNADFPPGRTEALIPLVRKVLGDEITLYADSNGSYDAPKAIEIGRLLEAADVAFYEEPCPFDYLEETKQVAEALTIPIAGGEQESSLRRFRWMIHNDCVQIVQPDLHYFGGFIRCIRVARMAAEAGIPCTPHMSGSGLGYLYMLHFASCVPNIGPYQEYKGKSKDIPVTCDTSSLESRDGVVRIPSGPGLGVDFDPDFVRKAEVVTG
ncbi:MAG: mandelate racemase/muconate lactonizing enzyme family protein [Fidelibacterota bacterium]|nr:MAG: mandelate racemase/muconate lactonizing enzyme family protein [Candidatus Neomarinimicrobiota bacterium]